MHTCFMIFEMHMAGEVDTIDEIDHEIIKQYTRKCTYFY